MEVLCAIAIVIMVVKLYRQHKQIEELKYHMNDLNNKLYYNYNLIKELLNDKKQKPKEGQEYRNVGKTQGQEQSGRAVQPVDAVHRQGASPQGADVLRNSDRVPLSVRLSTVERVSRPIPTEAKGSHIPVQPTTEGNRVQNVPVQPTAAGNRVPSTPVQPTATGNRVRNTPIKPVADGLRMPTPAQPTAADNRVQNTPVQPTATGSRVPTTPVQPMTAQNRPPQSYISNGAYEQPAKGVQAAAAEKPAQKSSFERWLGSHVFNIIASLLIFIGLIFFGTLVYEYISDFVKIAAMYLISGGIVALGVVFTKKHRNFFSLGLAGCGCGALFISILLTHIYFHAISDVAAFSLLTVWTAFTLFISKKVDSVLLSVTAHMGMTISVCFAFAVGFSADRILLPVIYQIVSISVVVVGNIFCCRKTYRFGLIVSMLIMMYSSIVMYTSLSGMAVSAAVASTLFGVQLLGSSFLSYLLAVTAAKFSTLSEKPSNEPSNRNIALWVHLANKTVWCISTFVNVLLVFTRLFSENSTDTYGALRNATLILAGVVIAHTIITVLLSEKLDFSTYLANISIYFLSAGMSLALIVLSMRRSADIDITYIFIVAAAVIAIIKLTGNRALTCCALILLSLDGLIMIFGGYYGLGKIGTPALSFGYMIMIAAMVICLWIIQTKENRDKYFLFFKGYIYFWVNLSIISILKDFDSAVPLTLTVLALIHIVLHAISYGKGSSKTLDYIIQCASAVILYASFFAIANTKHNPDLIVFFVILLVAAAGLFTVKEYECIKSGSSILQAAAGFTFTVFVSVIFGGYSDILSYSCFASVIFMTTALICIVTDLRADVKGLRYYGIAAIVISVFKLAIIDVPSAESFERALALVLSGVICLLLHVISRRKDYGKSFDYTVLAVSGVILYTSFVIIGAAKEHFDQAVVYVLLLLVTMGLFAIKSYECVKSKYIALQVLAGLTLTVFVCSVFGGYSNVLSYPCLVSVIFMTTALVCIVTDLKIDAVGLKYYGLTVIVISVFKLIVWDMMPADSFERALALTLSGTICLLLHVISRRKECGKALNYIDLGMSGIILYASFVVIGSARYNMDLIVLYIVLILVTAVLFVAKAYEFVKSKNVVFQALAGLTFTAFVSSVLGGYCEILSSGCFASVIFMTTALICIVTDLRFKKDGLGLYGLAAVMLSVFKLVTVDMLDADSFERVTAFTVSGAICILLHIISRKRGEDKVFDNSIIIVSGAILYASFIVISGTKNHPDLTVMYMLLFLVTAGLFTVTAYECIRLDSLVVQVLSGISFTVFICAVIHGYSDVLFITYISSIIYMATALICIALGFRMRAKGLRFYGLVLVMICVLKLVTIDVMSANSIARVAAFIFGGVICFAISGIYNRFERLYGEKISSTEETNK